MKKIPSYPAGASMSREFAPDLVTSDAHAHQKVGKSRYAIHEPDAGGSGKKPPVYKVHSGLGDSEPEKGKKYGGHTSPEPRYDHNAPLNNISIPKKKPANPQSKTWDDKKKKSSSIPKASGSDPDPKPKPNKHNNFPSSPKDMPTKKEPYDPPTKKDKK